MSGKPHLEFFEIGEDGWHTPDGYPSGVTQKILADNLNEKTKTGTRSLLMKFVSAAATTEAFSHAECEEVFVYSGDLIVGSGDAAVQFHAPNLCLSSRERTARTVFV